MKLINATLVSCAMLSLSACAVSIGDGAYDYDGEHRSRYDNVTVTLPSGDHDSFGCPDEMEAFVVDSVKEGKGMIYGCRSRDAALPALD